VRRRQSCQQERGRARRQQAGRNDTRCRRLAVLGSRCEERAFGARHAYALSHGMSAMIRPPLKSPARMATTARTPVLRACHVDQVGRAGCRLTMTESIDDQAP